MRTALSLPPTERDFRIYERVVLTGVSTRQAAGEFGLSQTRIRQLVQRVSQWLTETLPPHDDATDAAHLRYARHVAADRLEYFYSEAMHGWRLVQQPKYLGLAIRVLTAQSKLPVLPGTLDALAADAIEGALDDRRVGPASAAPQARSTSAGPPPTSPFAPPSRDCSPSTTTPPKPAAMPAHASASNPPTSRPSENLPPVARAAR